MTVVGVERQSKVLQVKNVVDVATLQANYDRLWLHVRIVYVLLVVLSACYLATAFTVFSASRHFFTSPAPTVTLDARVVWQNASSSTDNGMTAMIGEQTTDSLMVRRRRRSISGRHRLDDQDKHAAGRARRLRAARASDDFKHDGHWMTMQSKISVKLHCLERLFKFSNSRFYFFYLAQLPYLKPGQRPIPLSKSATSRRQVSDFFCSQLIGDRRRSLR